MRLRALRDAQPAAGEGPSIPSWVGACPREERNPATTLSSGVKVVSPDDTAQQPEGSEHARQMRQVRRSTARRRSEGPRDSDRELLEDTYRREKKWDDLVELYTSLLEVSPALERPELLEKLADVLWQELGDAAAARSALLDALTLDPSDDAIADYLEDIALSRDGGWHGLVDAVSAKILLCSDNPTKARLAERVVRWARGVMGDASTAERFLATMRTFDPAHPLVHQRLAKVYEDVGVWEAQREALERALSRAERDEDRCTLHASLGALLEERQTSPKMATSHYEQALEIDPHCLPALEGLERICRLTEQYARLRDVLEAQVDASAEREDRAGALLRLADLLERHFVKPADAARRYELALELDPSSTRAADGLERCWHALRDWARLGAALEQRAAATDDSRVAIRALERLAEVREFKQQDAAGAFVAWRRVYELDTAHTEAIRHLARLCAKQGDVTAAAAYRARLADLADDPREKARIHVAVGEMLAPDGRDPACARIHFERAVEMDPRSAVAWEQLQKLALRDRDMMYATFCLERRAEATESMRVKAQLLVELAQLRASLGDARGAHATYEYAFESDPTNEIAARAVLEAWVRKEAWSDAQRACDVLVAAATRDRDERAMLKLLRLSTRIALALGGVARAVVAAKAALDMAPEDVGAQDDALHVAHELRGHTEVRDGIQALVVPIVVRAMDLSPDALAKLGDVRLATGDERGGIEMLCLAAARQGDHVPALTSLADVFERRREWGRAANCKHRLARVVAGRRRREALLLEAADLWEKRCHAPARAAAVLQEALANGRADIAVRRRLVSLWEQLQRWDELIAALRALGELESDPARRAKHVYAGAAVARDRLRDPQRAATLYEEVLDLDASRLDAFERLVRLWTELHDWQALEVAYRRMLGRLSPGKDRALEHALYHQLGLVYRDRLGDVPRALEAFRQASAAAPADEEDRRILVELLVLTGQPGEAIGDMRAALANDPARASTHRALFELFLREGSQDRAWCAADALVHLQAADDVQRQFVTDFPPVGLTEVPGTLAPHAWGTHLIGPGVDARLSTVFRIFVPAVARSRLAGVNPRGLARFLSGELRADASPVAARFVEVVRNVSEILGMQPPRLLSRPKLGVPMVVAPTAQPTLFVSVPALEGIAPDLLPFLVARRVAELRPELVAHALFPTLSELKALLRGALRVAVATHARPPRGAEEAAVAAAVLPAEMEELRTAVSAIVGTQKRADVRRWHQQVALATSRAGLLVTGDLDLACRAVQCEGRTAADLTPAEWRSEMLRFLVSDEHADLRAAIGVNVEVRSEPQPAVPRTATR